jgi:hypothetical protein
MAAAIEVLLREQLTDRQDKLRAVAATRAPNLKLPVCYTKWMKH